MHQKKGETRKLSVDLVEVATLIPNARNVLYNYNKAVLNCFMDSIENVIIVEHFLNEQNQF